MGDSRLVLVQVAATVRPPVDTHAGPDPTMIVRGTMPYDQSIPTRITTTFDARSWAPVSSRSARPSCERRYAWDAASHTHSRSVPRANPTAICEAGVPYTAA